jgi:fructokinase
MNTTICFGEVLIDMLSNKLAGEQNQQESFTKFAGGAPANVSVAIAKLGGDAYFAGMLANDMFGDFLYQALKNEGVKTDYMRFTPSAKTALAFVSLDEDGDRTFEFYRDGSADLQFSPQDFGDNWFNDNVIFHFCSNTLTEQHIRDTTLYGVQQAKQAQCIVSFDINLRLNLWDSSDTPRNYILPLLPYCDVIKASKEELIYLADEKTPEQFIQQTLSQGCQLFIVTDSSNPVIWYTQGGKQTYKPKKINMVDATAAGDAFVGGLLYQLSLQQLNSSSFTALCADNDTLLNMIEFASLCGAHAASYKGAFTSLPSTQSLNDFRKTL